jgi:hypothetical protein
MVIARACPYFYLGPRGSLPERPVFPGRSIYEIMSTGQRWEQLLRSDFSS